MTTTTQLHHPYPLGTRVRLLADVMGDDVTGTIAGHVTYAHPGYSTSQRECDPTHMQDGYALHLDRGAYLERTDLPAGRRPWVGTIVAIRDAVELLEPEHQDDADGGWYDEETGRYHVPPCGIYARSDEPEPEQLEHQDDDENSPERVDARRAMFAGFGWGVTR